MKSITLIYFPLLKNGEERLNEKLNLKELSDYFLKIDEGLNLVEKDFPKVEVRHSLSTDNYFGGGPSESMVRVLHYHTKFWGDEESIKNATSSFMDFCGIPYGVGGNSKLLEDYFEKKGKKIKGLPLGLSCLEPNNRKRIVDKK
jgi:hypothetical protein